MTLRSKREVQVTRQKIDDLERLFESTRADSIQNDHQRELTLRSIRKTINAMREEVCRFEARAGTVETTT